MSYEAIGLAATTFVFFDETSQGDTVNKYNRRNFVRHIRAFNRLGQCLAYERDIDIRSYILFIKN